ncbi:molybdate ABC transporter substrate-binding protein [Alteromonas sp. 14N.309.X.WAT.G.H12]|uniref:molybdate ABC transporter substrate-binding protein n=1 Tax=Alteromonas sp. 14N.309.X.WAT.G.H12 TaxID=3120824 RepID=UPI002FD1D179
MTLRVLWFVIVSIGLSAPALGESSQVNIAVAANFAEPLKQVAEDFYESSGIKPVISVGSSGTLYAQILHGAPFDIFLSADAERPQRLLQEGKATRVHTYAKGRLALITRKLTFSSLSAFFTQTHYATPVAVANPKLAPYGVAAMETIRHFVSEDDDLPFSLVQGKSVVQTYQYFEAGNVDAAFVALSLTGKTDGDVLVVPSQFHTPIVQKMALIDGSEHGDEATRFMTYLLSPQVQASLKKWGYEAATDN